MNLTKIEFAGVCVDNRIAIPELQGDELVKAEKSLIGYINTIEGTARNQSWCSLRSNKVYNQYQFSDEEVLAQQKGNTYFIETATKELENLRKAKTLTPDREEYLLTAIEKAKKTITYKTKGQEYYKKYTELINNPNNEALKTEVAKLDKELELLDPKMKPLIETKEVNYYDHFRTSAMFPPQTTLIGSVLLNKLQEK